MASNPYPYQRAPNPYETSPNINIPAKEATFSKPNQSTPIGIDGLRPHTDAVVNGKQPISCSPIGDVFSPQGLRPVPPPHMVGIFGQPGLGPLTLSPSFSPEKELDYSLSESEDDDEDFSLPPSIFPNDYDNDTPNIGQLNNALGSFALFPPSPSNSPIVGSFGMSPSLIPQQNSGNQSPFNTAQKLSSNGSNSSFNDEEDYDYSENLNEDGLTSPSSAGQYGEHPFGEHPSRTLFVRNINSNVEDEELRQLFEVYGTIRSMYTQCKHRGFVMISYFDIRHAKSAMRHLQSKVIRRRKLDIHYSIPKDNPSEKDQNQGTLVVFNLDPSITCDELRKIFGSFGEIKEIRETPNKKHHKFIEFYDVRDADKAMKSLNKTEIKSKKIKIEPSRPGGARKNLINQLQSPELNPTSDDYEPPSPSLSSTSSNPSSSPAFSPLTNPVGSSPSFLYSAPSPSLTSSNPPNPSSPPIDLSPFQNTGSPYSIPRSPTLNPTLNSPLNSALSPKQKPILTSPSLNSNPNAIYMNMNLNMNNGNVSMPGTMSAFLQSNPTGSSSYMLNNNNNMISNNMNINNNMNNSISNNLMNSNLSNNMINNNMNIMHNNMMNSNLMNNNMINNNMMSNNMINNNQFSNNMISNNHSNHNGNNDYGFESNYSLFTSPPSIGQSSNNQKPKPRRNSVKSFNTPQRTSPWSPNSLYPLNNSNNLLSSSGPPMAQMNMSGNSPQMMGGPPTSSTGHKASRSYSLPVKMGNVNNNVNNNNNNNPNNHSDQSERNFELDKPKRNHHHKDDDNNNNNNNNMGNNNNKNSVSYALDIDSVLCGAEKRTTLMIKNIPNKYTQKMLLATVDELHKGLYDFFYLPIDFKNKCNVGYAFINFIDPKSIVSLYHQLHHNKWEKFNSEKVCEITYARIQGKDSLISHFQNSSLMSEDKKCRPIIFHSDGPNQGQQAPFPIGPNVRVRSKEESGMKSPLSNNNNNSRRVVPLTPQKLISNTVENGKASERTTSVRTRSYSYK